MMNDKEIEDLAESITITMTFAEAFDTDGGRLPYSRKKLVIINTLRDYFGLSEKDPNHSVEL